MGDAALGRRKMLLLCSFQASARVPACIQPLQSLPPPCRLCWCPRPQSSRAPLPCCSADWTPQSPAASRTKSGGPLQQVLVVVGPHVQLLCWDGHAKGRHGTHLAGSMRLGQLSGPTAFLPAPSCSLLFLSGVTVAMNSSEGQGCAAGAAACIGTAT